MKYIILILLLCSSIFAFGNLKERLSKLQQTNQQMIQQENVKQMPLIPEEEPKVFASEVESAHSQSGRTVFHDKITKIEVKQEYIEKDISDIKATEKEMQEVLYQMVGTMEAQTKIAEIQKDKGARIDTILNITMAIVGFIVTGGSGYFAYRNKHIIFKPKDSSDSKDDKTT